LGISRKGSSLFYLFIFDEKKFYKIGQSPVSYEPSFQWTIHCPTLLVPTRLVSYSQHFIFFVTREWA
jgi:hypothetical protein